MPSPRLRQYPNVRHNCMDTPKLITELTNDIWDISNYRPTKDDIDSFEARFLQFDIKEFIIHNFLNHHGTKLRPLLLSTFKFWSHLTLADWKQIFKRLDKS